MTVPGNLSSPLLATAAGAAAAAVATKSLRFNAGDSAHLSKTFGSAGNRKTWTWSGWVKRSGLTSGADLLFAVYQDSSNRGYIQFQASTDKILLFKRIGGTDKYEYSTDAVFRDPSAWYHIVIAFDTTQATASNRVKIYVNGVEQSLTATTTAAQNLDTLFNAAQPHYLGRDGSSQYFDGYLADVYFIDGSQLDATSFGAYDSNGVWQAAAYSGTYGTNGFHLAFGDSSSSAALGTDSSGNSNTFTVNNISGDAVGLSTANQGFDVVTYTGTGSTRSISGLNFQPDFVWIKTRNVSDHHILYDSVRGVRKQLYTTLTNAEETETQGLSAFTSDGFTVNGAHTVRGQTNDSSNTYVAWCWKAGGSASSNTDGTITSSVSASTTYGFSVVAYQGNNNAGATVGHGLSSTPKWIIVKSRDQAGQFWHVYHASLDADEYAYLNNSNAVTSGNDFMNGTRPTSSVFSLGNGNGCNKSGDNVIAYCWAEVSGFSKISSYNGSGGAATKVVTGFRPRYIIARPINDSNGNRWHIVDTERGVGGSAERLFAEDSATHTARQEVLIENDGFVVTNTTTDSGSLNRNTEYIYAAFASKPTGEDIDSLFDVPTNGDQTDTGAGGEVSGNYAVINALNAGGNSSLTDGNLKWTRTSNGYSMGLATIGVSSGKWYYEHTFTGSQNNAIAAGIVPVNDTSSYPGQNSNSVGYNFNGTKVIGTTQTSYGATYDDGDVIGVAFDADNGTVVFYKNGVSQGTATSSLSSGPYTAAVSAWGSGTGSIMNFGQRPFAYSAPSNYKALCTANLPTATIADGSDYFAAKIFTGNGSSTKLTTDFSPDMVWLKSRASAFSHYLGDTVRGNTKLVRPSSTAAEITSSTGITSFDSDGVTLGSGSETNANNDSMVAWIWDGGTSTASNTDGSITSSVRANQTAGFSIVSWTGTGANATVGHGLNTQPGLVLVKNRDATASWAVWHNGLTGSQFLGLNTVNAAQTSANYWNSTVPTSSVFSVGTDSSANGSSNDMIAYCISPVAGFSAVGSYTGNGNADGVFVYTGFRPSFLMVKGNNNLDFGGSIVASYSWFMYDSARNTYNATNSILAANKAFDEEDAAAVDFLSNGFKLRNNNAPNATVAQYYVAFAENPFQANGGLAR